MYCKTYELEAALLLVQKLHKIVQTTGSFTRRLILNARRLILRKISIYFTYYKKNLIFEHDLPYLCPS